MLSEWANVPWVLVIWCTFVSAGFVISISSLISEKGPCQLLLSDTHNGDSPRLLYLYKRWVSSIYVIKGDGFGSYLIRSLGVAKSAATKLAKYSIALQYLVYEGIAEDGEQSDEWVFLSWRDSALAGKILSTSSTYYCWNKKPEVDEELPYEVMELLAKSLSFICYCSYSVMWTLGSSLGWNGAWVVEQWPWMVLLARIHSL